MLARMRISPEEKIVLGSILILFGGVVLTCFAIKHVISYFTALFLFLLLVS